MTKQRPKSQPKVGGNIVADITADQARENVKRYAPPDKCLNRLIACLKGISDASKEGRLEYTERQCTPDETVFLVKELKERKFNVTVLNLNNDKDESNVYASWRK